MSIRVQDSGFPPGSRQGAEVRDKERGDRIKKIGNRKEVGGRSINGNNLTSTY